MGLCFSRRRRRIFPKRKTRATKPKQDKLVDDVNTVHRNIIATRVPSPLVQSSDGEIREATQSVSDETKPNNETDIPTQAREVVTFE